MAPAPQDILDGFIVGSAAVYSAVGMAHVVLIWRARKNFFVALRSPLLTCVSGVCVVSRYISAVSSFVFGGVKLANDVDMVSLPAIWVTKISIVLMAARLFVMYYPIHRPKYGCFTNEARLVHVLLWFYVLLEATWWLVAAIIGRSRVSRALVSFSLPPPLLTAVASTCILWRLRHVDDLINMSRDIRVVAIVLLVTFPLNLTGKMLLQPHSLQQKYTMIAYFTLSYTPIVWILNIRPAREILLQQPQRRLLPFFRRVSMQDARVGVAPSASLNARRASCADSSRLSVIMAIGTLRAAFGEFCCRSLCGESFQFVEDVAEFNEYVLLEAEMDAKKFKGFGGYVAIVNDYIRDSSHSEVNIDSRTKKEILKWCTFDAYSTLNIEERMTIFSRAEKEVLGMLADNLLNRFMLSEQYKKSANF